MRAEGNIELAKVSRIGRPTLYDVLNGYVDGGWLTKLNSLQKDVWTAYVRHANFSDDGGESRPGIKLIADEVGRKPNHIRAARAVLVRSGLLELISAGSVQARRAARYRVVVPPVKAGTSPELGLVQNLDSSQTRTSPILGLRLVPILDSDASQIGTHNHEENHEENHEGEAGENDDAAAEAIYNLYPLKRGKPSALKAIKSAIKRLRKAGHLSPVVFLKSRTTAYASERRAAIAAGTSTPHHTKHPQGWFNDDRFDDESSLPAEVDGTDVYDATGPRAPITQEILDCLPGRNKP